MDPNERSELVNQNAAEGAALDEATLQVPETAEQAAAREAANQEVQPAEEAAPAFVDFTALEAALPEVTSADPKKAAAQHEERAAAEAELDRQIAEASGAGAHNRDTAQLLEYTAARRKQLMLAQNSPDAKERAAAIEEANRLEKEWTTRHYNAEDAAAAENEVAASNVVSNAPLADLHRDPDA